MDIEQIIERSDWKQILIDLVIKNRLDPWDLDLELLAEKIKEKIKSMDFRVSGDLLLAYAIILKYRALLINVPETEIIDQEQSKIELVRPPRKAPISLKYLIKIIRKYIRRHKKMRRMRMEQNHEPLQQDIEIELIDEEDFNIKIEKFMKFIEKEIMFSDIPGDKLENFLSMLLLTNEGKLEFYQDKPFDDIKIVKVGNHG